MSPLDWSATGELPGGATLIEASAGTGKTWNIAGLFVRLIAEEGLAVDQILVVTFTDAATAELKDRIRARIRKASEALTTAAAPGGGLARPDDPVLAHLAGVGSDGAWQPHSHERLEERIHRLRRAEEDFDAAAISTIHGFCRQVLRRFSFECDQELGVELEADLGPILTELVDDHLATLAAELPTSGWRFVAGAAHLGRDEAMALARKVAGMRDAQLLPAEVPPWRATLDAYGERHAAVAAAWAAGGALAIKKVHTAIRRSVLSQQRYHPGKFKGEVAALGAWLDGPAVPLPNPPGRWFTPEALAAGTNSGKRTPTDPLFDQIEALRTPSAELINGPRAELAHRVREELPARLAERGLQAFEDLLHKVADTLRREPDGVVVRALREQFHAALIDEFQDTDRTQWDIFGTLFGRPDDDHHLFLIGDPKQAIYSFRGADVFVYREASESVRSERRFTMRRNYRSDPDYIAAMNALMKDRPGVLGHPEIPYIEVDGAPDHAGRILLPDRAPLRLRWFDTRAEGSDHVAPLRNKEACWRLVPKLVASDVVELLSSDVRITKGDTSRRVLPSDIAILVRTNRQARTIQGQLLDQGVMAVVASSGSVFASDEATWMARWLEAMAAPGREGPARLLAVSPLGGWTTEQLDAVVRDHPLRWAGWIGRISDQARLFGERGFAAAFLPILRDGEFLARELARAGGERRVTNFAHLAELMHEAARRDHLGPAALLQWLRQRRTRDDLDGDAVQLRLESDAGAVQVVTLHKSKGLDYPIVFLPYFWDGSLGHPGDASLLAFHRPGGERVLDVRVDGEGRESSAASADEETWQEKLRLLYVGLTRAEHAAVVYWGTARSRKRAGDCIDSPLASLLHGGGPQTPGSRRDRGKAVISSAIETDVALLPAELARLFDPALVEVSACERPSGARWEPHDEQRSAGAPPVMPELYPRDTLSSSWRRVSYTALARDQEVGSHPPPDDEQRRDYDALGPDPSAPPTPEALRALAARSRPVPLADFPRGKEAGKYVHRVFELIDFRSGDELVEPRRPLAALCREVGRTMGFDDPAVSEQLAAELPGVLQTPLGACTGDRCLADLEPSDRLDELDFDLPLAGGDRWQRGAAPVDGRVLAQILADRPATASVSRHWLDAVGTMDFGGLAGFLTGSIDLVFRIPEGDTQRWFIADYKTNRLGPRSQPGRPGASCVDHYGHPWMIAEMAHHAYYLQYHLYLVALHRFLRWRLPDYDYDRHVGGALYLFVRGMTGPLQARTGPDQVHGVFHDLPPARVIVALSDLFDGEGP